MKANPLCVTPLSVAIHRRSENPVYGEGAIHVSVDDTAAGAFLRIRSLLPGPQHEAEISIEIEELKLVYTEAMKLINAHRALEDKK